MRPLNANEQRELQQELYSIYEEQLTLWFELLSEDRKLEVIEKNRDQENQLILKSIMESPGILWN